MRFHFGHLSPVDFECGEMALTIVDHPYPHVEVGRPNKANKFFRLWIGLDLHKKIRKVETICPRDGDATPGECSHCGVLVTPEMAKSVPSGKKTLINGVAADLFESRVEHPLITKATQIPFGAIMLGKKRGTLLVVQEKARDRIGTIGLLLRADGLPGEGTAIKLLTEDQNPVRMKINTRAKGEIWRDPDDRWAGFDSERFMVVKPGDRIKVTQFPIERGYGPMSEGERVTMIGIMPDFTLKAIRPLELVEMNARIIGNQAEVEVEEPTPEEIEEALQEGVERFSR